MSEHSLKPILEKIALQVNPLLGKMSHFYRNKQASLAYLNGRYICFSNILF